MAIDNGSIYWIGNYQGVEYTEENPLEIEVTSNEETKEITINIKNLENEIIKIDETKILDFTINSWSAHLGVVYNRGFSLQTTSIVSSKLIGVSTLVSFTRDYENGEPVDQAFISSLGGSVASWGISFGIGVLASGIGTATLPAVALTLGVGLAAGYVGSEFGDFINDTIDQYIFEDQILVEFGENVKSTSLEAWNALKEMSSDFKALIDQGIIDIQLKFDDWSGSLLDFITSEETNPHSYLLGGNDFDSIMAFYNGASTAQIRRRDPLVLDLDGDGIEIDPLGSGAHFDLDRNGFAEETAWVNKDDGLLVLDRNGDGIINDGGELFGDQTTLADGTIASTGFEALAELDTNEDSIISSEDDKFKELRVWQDTNSDGFTDEGELKTMEEAGITAIDLENQTVNKDIAGNNTIVREGVYFKVDGTLGNVGELLFERDTLNTEGNEVRENEDDIRAQLLENLEVAFLPDFKGYGTVHSLRYSILQDANLQELVTSFTSENDIDTRRELLQDILELWTGNDQVDPSSRGGNIDGQKLTILESFMGEDFVGVSGSNPNSVAASLLNRAYTNLFNNIYYTLLMQEQMSVVGYLMGGEGDEFVGIGTYLKKIIDDDVMVGIDFYRELTGAAATFGWTKMDSYREMIADLTTEYNFLADPKAIYTGSLEDDNLIADIGSNIMIGGRGDDTLQGGFGNDTYIFNKGDGWDTIYDGFYTKGGKYEERNYSEYGTNYNGGTDSISFGSGIEAEDIQVVKDGDNLIIGIKEEGIEFENLTDKITIEKWFDKKLRVESVKFSDGTDLGVGHLLGLSLGGELEGFEASGNSINLIGTSKHNVIETLEGNDTIDGGKGHDLLSGGEGDDIIIGGEGRDTLIGGKGTDELLGGKGNDTYIYNSGDGKDIIYDIYIDNGGSGNTKNNDKHNSAGNDTLVLGDGITAGDLLIKRSGSDLLIGILKDGDDFDNMTEKITIKDGMNKSTMIENLEVSEVNYSFEKLVQAMAEIPDDGIVDFGKVSKGLEEGNKLSDISQYLYKEEDKEKE